MTVFDYNEFHLIILSNTHSAYSNRVQIYINYVEGPAPFSGHALLFCSNNLYLEHLILTPNFLNLFRFLGSLLSSGPLIRNFQGLPGATLGLGGSNMSCPTTWTHCSSLDIGYINGAYTFLYISKL
jgi:hypothetical protein